MLFRSKTAIKILSQTSQYHTHLHFNTNIGEIANFTITTITIFATFTSDAKSKQTRSTLSNVFNSIANNSETELSSESSLNLIDDNAPLRPKPEIEKTLLLESLIGPR